ncbi:MAG: iron-sulfur cluster-binding domain-containing protein [Bdellovibrionales bacterium]|nr:iron-sulfur cluster-binding domain-containing protein [Bdellovibrionales bacterium]
MLITSEELIQATFHFFLGTLSFFLIFFILRAQGKKKFLKLNELQTLRKKNLWHEKSPLIVTKITRETHNINIFHLKRKDEAQFPFFKAGQFLSFQIGNNPQLIRSYSLVSNSNQRNEIQIAVKKIPGGIGSQWFHSLHVGDLVLAYAPQGHFYDTQFASQARLYVAGGIGITPLYSMITSHLNHQANFPIYLFYGVRTAQDLAFHVPLTHLAKEHFHFHYFPILADNDENKELTQGVITGPFIQKLYPHWKEAVVFMCGPEGLTHSLSDFFLKNGFPKDRIFLEKFSNPSTFNLEQIPDDPLPILWENQKLQYNTKVNLLTFLEQNGFNPPFACRVGVCGSCKHKALGQTLMATTSGLTPQEQAQGYILTCVAYPLSPIEFEETT